MTRAMSVFSEPAAAGLVREVLASLPVSFIAAVSTSDADVIVVSGGHDWADRAIGYIERGARRLLVVKPAPAEAGPVRDLAKLAADTDAAVILSEPFAGNPALDSLAQQLVDIDVVTLEAFGADDSPPMLFEHLRVARAAGIDSLELVDVVAVDGSSLAVLRGEIGGKPMLLRMLVCSTNAGRTRHRIRAYGMTTVVTGVFYDADSARAALVSSSHPGAGTTQPTIYENAHRASWRALHAGRRNTDLDAFASDVELLNTLLP